jgi:hypothetical protein
VGTQNVRPSRGASPQSSQGGERTRPARGASTSETQLQQDIRLELGRLPDFRLWRNTTGVAQHGQHVQRFGLCVGSSDLIGILAPAGRFVALEVKSATGRTTREQDMFLALIRRLGGFAAVVRSPQDAVAALKRARAGGSE